MDIREYFQKKQKGFYKIIAKTLTVERRKQLYDAINDWHESELKLLGIADVVGRSEQFGDVSENEEPPNNDKPDWNGNCWNQI